ncbi:MAG TPA: tetratricopeptide repeat protein, partial [Terriglobales bacterium]|nr:tetratricopeptide repeat protein [Terriglobales bacterium]
MAMDNGPEDLTERLNTEWDTYRRWIAAHSQGSESKPELPRQLVTSKRSAWIGVPTTLMLVGFVLIGAMARRARLHRARAWAAEKEIAFDHFWYEPGACGLSKAYTRLGLARLAMGDKKTAIDCLERSFQVHPCPHNVNF